jgi:hypothetical protein
MTVKTTGDEHRDTVNSVERKQAEEHEVMTLHAIAS